MKKAFLIFMISIMAAAAFFGCAQEEKFVGSKDTPGFGYDMQIYQTVDEIKDSSAEIVIASYSSDPTECYEKDEGTGMELYATRYTLDVEKVLKGDLAEADQITFMQTGKPDSDEYETKIKKGKKYLLFLAQKDVSLTGGEIIYDAVGVEQGIIEIKENNKLYSYYDEGIMTKYDGESLSKLAAEIK